MLENFNAGKARPFRQRKRGVHRITASVLGQMNCTDDAIDVEQGPPPGRRIQIHQFDFEAAAARH